MWGAPTLCHCSKPSESPWDQVSSGITGLTYLSESRDSSVSPTAKKLSYLTQPLKVEETSTSYLNWSNFSVGSCNAGDGLPSPLPLIPRIVLHPLFPSVISSLFTCTSLVTGFWQCWSVTLKLLSFISDALGNRINRLPEDSLGSGLFWPVLEPNGIKGSFLIPKLESE